MSSPCNGTLQIWDSATQRIIAECTGLARLGGKNVCVVGDKVLAILEGKMIGVWDFTGNCTAELYVGEKGACSIYAAGNSTFITGYSNGSIGIWDLTLGKEIATIKKDTKLHVQCVTDGKILAKSELGIYVYDLATQVLLAQCNPESHFYGSCLVGNTIVGINIDTSFLRCWDISMLSQLAGATAQHAAAICDYIDPITQNEGAQPDGWQKPITWQGIADILSSKKESQAVLEKLGLTQTAETFPV